jgi:DNA processing protein
MRLVESTSEGFPRALRDVAGMPPALYVRGVLRDADALAVAVVGARLATPYGVEMAERLAGDLARRGVTIVSGLARGIDTAAHRGALRAGGRTIAVLGCGVDVAYPKENARLAAEIAERGALVSEFPPGTPPLAPNFPRRNRVIAGLALGVVVVEAAARSGSSITAGWAADLGREVMAVPGRATSEMSRGCHALIKDGATLVETWEDVAGQLPSPWRDRLGVPAPAASGPGAGPADAHRDNDRALGPRAAGEHRDDIARLLRAIGEDPVSIEEIIEGSGVASGRAAALLLTLELEGRVRQLAGKRFVRFPRG